MYCCVYHFCYWSMGSRSYLSLFFPFPLCWAFPLLLSKAPIYTLAILASDGVSVEKT